MSLATPGDWLLLIGMVVSIVLNITQSRKNVSDGNRSDGDLTKMLTEAASNLVKPLNDRIDDLEEMNKQKDLEIKRLGTRITELEKQVGDLQKENDKLKNCGE